MATDLLTRVKQRTETDVADEELQNLIDSALSDIEQHIGPVVDPANPITVTVPGRVRRLDLMRPCDDAHPIAVVEHYLADPFDVEYSAELDVEGWWPDIGDTPRTLDADDYRVLFGGRQLERLYTGTNPAVRWGSRVDVTYVPVDDGNQRAEVAIKLVLLSLVYDGKIDERVGDVQITKGLRSGAGGDSPLLFADERERLINSLRPRKGLMLR